jgi:predicted transcriptional regulator
MKKTELIQVRVEEELRQKLQKLADADHRTLGDFIRHHLIKLTEETQSPEKPG